MVSRDAMVEVLVTGGAGFIGSNFVLHALATHPDWRITTLDKLTYAGRMENLRDVINDPRHRFVQGDVTDAAVATPLVRRAEIIVHFAAETHVDRSLQEAGAFITTDVGPQAARTFIPSASGKTEVKPAFLSLLGQPVPNIKPMTKTSGRRSALAKCSPETSRGSFIAPTTRRGRSAIGSPWVSPSSRQKTHPSPHVHCPEAHQSCPPR